MKIGDKVKLSPHHKSDVLADNLANVAEGDISKTRGDKIEELVNSDATFIIHAKEDEGFELRPQGKAWIIYGLHEENDLILV